MEGGYLMYFPAAFDADGQKAIADIVPAEKLIEVDAADAEQFCCNAVDLNRQVFHERRFGISAGPAAASGVYPGHYAAVGIYESRRRGEVSDAEIKGRIGRPAMDSVDLLPVFRTSPSMISDEGKGKGRFRLVAFLGG